MPSRSSQADLRPELHYPLPHNSKGAQPRLRGAGIRAQWATVERFLARCTDTAAVACPPAGDASLKLRVGAWGGDAVALAPAIARAQAQFGAVVPEVDPTDPEEIEYTWSFGAERLGEAVDFVAAGEPWAFESLSPVSVDFMAMFRWHDPRSGGLLPGQRPVSPVLEGERPSWLVVSLGPDGFAAGRLAFPFERVDDDFLGFLAAVAPALPFDFSPRHLRAAHPSTDGTFYRLRRLPAEEVARAREALELPSAR